MFTQETQHEEIQHGSKFPDISNAVVLLLTDVELYIM